MNKKQKILDIILIILTTIIVGTILIMLSDADPAKAYAMFFKGIFGSVGSFTEIFVKATPLILTGLGCAVAFKTGFFNIGAEGQFYMGAVAATTVALTFDSLPGVLRIIIAIFAGFLCGGLWALIAAIFKAKFGISEIIVTIMLNYIAINFVGIAVRSFLMDPVGSVPQSSKIADNVQLAQLIPNTRLHIGFLIAIVAVLIIWLVMEKTTIGYEMKIVGYNKRAAKCNGVSTIKNIIISAFLSGGLAGIAGVIEVLAIQKKLLEGISSDCGYTAILVALLASNNPIGVLFSAVGFAAMQVGSNSMQRQLGVPSAIVNILIGLVVLLILARGIFRKKNLKSNKLS